MNKPSTARNIVCPSCGKVFLCSHSKDCWCAKISISERASAYLKENFSDCVCKECLEKLAKKMHK